MDVHATQTLHECYIIVLTPLCIYFTVVGVVYCGPNTMNFKLIIKGGI